MSEPIVKFNFSILINPTKPRHYLLVVLILLLVIAPLTFIPTNSFLGDNLVSVIFESESSSRSPAENRISYNFNLYIKTNYDASVAIPVDLPLFTIEYPTDLDDSIISVNVSYIYPDFLQYHEDFSLLVTGPAYSYTVEADGITTRFTLIEFEVDFYFTQIPDIGDIGDGVIYYVLTPQNLMMVPILGSFFARDVNFVYAPLEIYADGHWESPPAPIADLNSQISDALLYRNAILVIIPSYLILIAVNKAGVRTGLSKSGTDDHDDLYPDDR